MMRQKIKQFFKAFRPKPSVIDFLDVVDLLGPDAYVQRICHEAGQKLAVYVSLSKTEEQLDLLQHNELVKWMEVEGEKLYYLTHYGATTLRRFRE